MGGKGSWEGEGMDRELPRTNEGELPYEGWRQYVVGTWRDGGATVSEKNGEGSIREGRRESYLRVDGEGATLEEWRGSYLGWDGGGTTWAGRTQISSLQCWTLGRACTA
jgi:hypothetical protein